jgi:hypothetical protein
MRGHSVGVSARRGEQQIPRSLRSLVMTKGEGRCLLHECGGRQAGVSARRGEQQIPRSLRSLVMTKVKKKSG